MRRSNDQVVEGDRVCSSCDSPLGDVAMMEPVDGVWRKLDADAVVERVGDDWRTLVHEAVTEMMRRTQAPAGVVSCCIWAATLPGQVSNDLFEREAAGDEAAEAELTTATEANIEMEDELGRILQTAGDLGARPN